MLAALPAAEYEALHAALERTSLDTRRVLIDVDRPIDHVYFPESCVVSVLSLTSDGAAIETATIGHEGMVGLPVYLGTDRMAAQAFCQIPGEALRLDADTFREMLDAQPTLRALLGRYTQALFTLIAQSAACNRLHDVRQRCARWLLHTHDRVGRDEFPLTHQFLSQMLGVRRAGVTEAAGALQDAGLIAYAYGRIVVRDHAGLEQAACECYRVVRHEFARLLEGRASPHPLAEVETAREGLSTARDGTPRGSAADET